jgi:hypothetical protein
MHVAAYLFTYLLRFLHLAVTRAEISPRDDKIVTTSFDRTWKLWAWDDAEEDVL